MVGPEAPPASSRGRRSAFLVSAGIVVSRLFGLVRQRVFAYYFGNSWMADAFTAALRLPNITQNLLGEGTLSASFIPIYAQALGKGEEERARAFAREALGALLLMVLAVSVLGVIFAAPLTRFIVPGFEGERFGLAVHLVRIFFPMTGLLALSAWSLGVLNSHRRYFLPYVAPVLWSLSQVVAMLIGGRFTTGAHLVVVLGYGALVGAGLQLLVQLPTVRGLVGSIGPRFHLGSPDVRRAGRALGPVVLGRGVVQISAFFDTWLASLLPIGANADLGYVSALYSLPVSLFGVGAAAVALPEAARVSGEGAAGLLAIRTQLGEALTRVAFMTVPTTLVFLVLPDQVVGAFYQTGKFDAAATQVVAKALVGAGIGLLANTSVRVLATAFYALHDTVTPMWFSIARIVLSIGLSYVLMRQLGIFGLTLGSAIGAWIEIVLMGFSARKRLGGLGLPLGRWGKIFLAAGLGAAAGWGAKQLPLPGQLGRTLVILRAVVSLGAMGTIYLAAAAVLRLPDVFEVWMAVRRRLGR